MIRSRPPANVCRLDYQADVPLAYPVSDRFTVLNTHVRKPERDVSGLSDSPPIAGSVFRSRV